MEEGKIMGCLFLAIIVFVIGIVVGVVICVKKFMRLLDKSRGETEKYLQLYRCMNEWLKKKQDDKRLAEFLSDLGYKKIAIYGMGIVGERLVSELEETTVEISYVIDKNPDKVYSIFDVLSPKDALPKVDAVIITPIYYYDEIEEMISVKLDCPIVALDDLIYDL